MDKNFNDQELSDIMKEIEALEEGFHEEGVEAPASSVLEELAEMKEAEAIPLKPRAVAKEYSPSQHSSMSFRVQGDLQLDLHFEVGGKIISMNVTEAGLTIEVDGGMTFNVPLKNKSAA